jgi:hypothetical protein
MGAPIEIKNMDDVIQELMAVSSSLNMYIFETDEDRKLNPTCAYITETSMGKHAASHLSNVFRYLSKLEREKSSPENFDPDFKWKHYFRDNRFICEDALGSWNETKNPNFIIQKCGVIKIPNEDINDDFFPDLLHDLNHWYKNLSFEEKSEIEEPKLLKYIKEQDNSFGRLPRI